MVLLLLALAMQRPDSLGAAVRKVVRISSARVVLEHVNVIDGTGAAATPDRDITIEGGRITAISEPTHAIKPKRAIDAGVLPGPHLDVTGPYLDGPGGNLQMPELTGPKDARDAVAYWADRGVTSFKAYAHITREELRAAISEAHRRSLKVTGHLCSVTYDEAIALGIDNLEHGFSANTALDPDKKPDTCSASGGDYTLMQMSPGGTEANRLIAALIAHHVAITSTLPLRAAAAAREASDTGPPLRAEVRQAMCPSARQGGGVWRGQTP